MFCKEDKQMSFFCDDEEFDYDECKSGDSMFVGMADIRRLGYHNVLKNFAKVGVIIHIIPFQLNLSVFSSFIETWNEKSILLSWIFEICSC